MTDSDGGKAPRRRAEPILRPHTAEPLLRPPERRSILQPEAEAATRAPAPVEQPPAPPPPAPPPPAPPPPLPAPAAERPVPRHRAPTILSEAQAPVTPGSVAASAARIVLCAGIFAVPLVFDPRTVEVFNLAKITLVAVCAVASVGLTAAAAVLRGPVSFRWSRTIAAAAVLLTVTGAATALSTNRTLSVFGLYRRYGGLVSLVLYVVCAALVVVLYSRRRGALIEVATALVASAALVAVYRIVQRAGADPFHWLATTGATSAHATGSLGNTDVAGGFLAIALPFAVYLFAASRRVTTRIAAAAGWALVVAGLVLMRSGIGLAAAAGGLVALVIFASAVPRVAKAAAVAVMVAGFAVVPLIKPASFGYRTDDWDVGWRMAVERPVLGFGPETYYANFPRFRTGLDARTRELAVPDKPHNVFVEWAASAGFAGLLAFLVLVGSVVWLIAGGTAALPRHLRLLGAAIGGGLVAYVLQAVFGADVPPIAMTAWIVIGAAAALLEPSRRTDVGESVRIAPWRFAVAALAVVVAGAGAWAAFRPLRADHAAFAADKQGAGWSDDAVRLHAKAIRLNRREAAYRSLAAVYFERVSGVDGTPLTPRQALLASVALFKAAAALQPRNTFFALDAARVYARLGERRPEYYASADEWLARAVAIDPLDPQVHDVRATVLSQWAAHTEDPAIGARAVAELRTAERLRNGG